MKIIHSHLFFGMGDVTMVTTKTVVWDEIINSLPDIVMDASAWNTYYTGEEYAVEFVYGDLDEVFKTRIVGTRAEMIPFYRIMMLLIELKKDWRRDWPSFFLSICTYVVGRADDSRYMNMNLMPDPLSWDELSPKLLRILTGQKVWLH